MKNIVIAKITSPHGVKGFVKLISFVALPADVVKYSGKIFDAKNNFYKIKIVSQLYGKGDNFFVVKIDGVEDRNAAEKIVNTELFIKRSDLKEVKKDEFYYVDLIGLDVLNLDKKIIGKVLAVNDFGAGSVIEIGFGDDLKRVESFAFSGQIFPEVDIQKGFLVIDFPDEIEVSDDG
jgi:16S rRNA processing protein RimM